MTTDESYRGQHREPEAHEVIGAAIRLLMAEAIEARGTQVFADIEQLDPEARAVIYRALEDQE